MEMENCFRKGCIKPIAIGQLLCITCWSRLSANQRNLYNQHRSGLIVATESILDTLNTPGSVQLEIRIK